MGRTKGQTMTFLRSILLLVTLVTQALPVGMVSTSVAEEKCAMSCCAALAQDGLDDCGCAAAPGVPTTPSPASLPPAHGREVMPQFVCAELSDFQGISSSAHADTDRALRPEFVTQTVTMPHVRLAVLFCSFLH
jgi:hypothetical protein